MMRPTFAGFTTAQFGMSTAMNSLNITGQNISNISTVGYTRQAADQISMNLTNPNGAYSIGFGALTTSTSQLRDPYLDIRFRTEIASVGENEVIYNTLTDLESIFDEFAKVGVQEALTDLMSSFQDYSSNVNSAEFQEMIKASSDSLVKLINEYTNQLDTVRSDTVDGLTDVDIPNVNDILSRIGELTQSIETTAVIASTPLELLDQRNLLIDELASYLPIKVTYVATDVQPGVTIDRLHIELVNTEGENYTLVDGPVAGSFNTYTDEDTGDQIITYTAGIGENMLTGTGISVLNNALEKLNAANTSLEAINQAISDNAGDTKAVATLLNEKLDYLSYRDGLLEQINAFLPIEVTDTGNDTVSIAFTPMTLNTDGSVKDPIAIDLTTGDDVFTLDTDGSLLLSGANIMDELTSGELTFSSGSIKGSLDMLNSYGDAVSQKGLRYYEAQLDEFAITIAEVFNQMNNVGDPVYVKTASGAIAYELAYEPILDGAGDPVLDETGRPMYYDEEYEAQTGTPAVPVWATDPVTGAGLVNDDGTAQQATRTTLVYEPLLDDDGNIVYVMDGDDIALDQYGNRIYYTDATATDFSGTEPTPMAKDLFSFDPADPSGTLRIAENWKTGLYTVSASQYEGAASGANDNILNFIGALEGSHAFETYMPDHEGGALLSGFTGSFYDYFTNIATTVGLETKTTYQSLENYIILVADIADSKSSVSGVNLDEEGMNLIQYQSAYSAAARLMTTLDEALETLLNMGRVGR
ncbi:MAG: flagellar basal body rod C-terminal domain-containing protein [Bacillota bacterium]